jgi:hypothetical protein
MGAVNAGPLRVFDLGGGAVLDRRVYRELGMLKKPVAALSNPVNAFANSAGKLGPFATETTTLAAV